MVSLPTKLSRCAQPPMMLCSTLVQPRKPKSCGARTPPRASASPAAAAPSTAAAAPQRGVWLLLCLCAHLQAALHQRRVGSLVAGARKRLLHHVARAPAERGHRGGVPHHGEQRLEVRAQRRVLALGRDLHGRDTGERACSSVRGARESAGRMLEQPPPLPISGVSSAQPESECVPLRRARWPTW